MALKKLKVGVLLGGRSAEHEVSIVSARSVIQALDKKKYQVIPIGVSKQGRLIAGATAIKILESGARLPQALVRTLPPDPTIRSLVSLTGRGVAAAERPDVIIPLIHGTYGEDGTVQGLLELAGVPYVGAGVLGSALGMDKIAQKLVYCATSIPTSQFEWFTSREWKTDKSNILRRLKKLGLPVFVKPANLGSSVGISKVKQGSKLAKAIGLAFKYDRRVLVEKAVPDPIEIEVSVLGNDAPRASVPGQILPSNEFYDYDAKYIDGKSKAIIPAPLPRGVANRVRGLAVQAFKALDLAGMARVDFLVNRKTYQIFLNEVNTIPGFTSISMYPKLWAASGLPYTRLLTELIQLALERFKEKARLNTSYRPKKPWHR